MIRDMRVGEAGQVAQMAHALAAHHGDQATLVTEQLAQMVRAGWLQVLVAVQDGTLVGYAALVRHVQLQHGAVRLDVHHLYVTPQMRRQGLGSSLLRAARTKAHRQGCAGVIIGTTAENAEAAQLYLNAGFVERPVSGRRFVLPI